MKKLMSFSLVKSDDQVIFTVYGQDKPVNNTDHIWLLFPVIFWVSFFLVRSLQKN